MSGESFVESFHTKDAAIGALFELQGNYDDHVLYDAEQNIYYPQIKGSPNKSEKELNGLRRVWLPMRTIAPFHSIMPSTFNDKFSDPALGFEANDVYLHQQGISDHCAIRGGSKFSADTMRLASRYRVESTSQGFRPESTLTVERLDYISPELLDFQRKEQEHFRKLVESKRSATKQAASHHDGVSPQKTRRNAQTEQMMEGAEQWSFATDSVRRNLDSGYHSIRWNENARTSRAVPNAVVRHYSPPPKFSYPAWGTKATSLSWDISPKTTTTETRADAEAATPSKAAKTRFVRAISYVKCNPETSLNPSFYSSVRKNKVKTIQIFGDAPKAQLQPLTPTIVRPSLALTDRSVSQAITEIDGDFGEPLVRDDSLGSGSEEGSMSTVCDGTERLWRDVELYG